ncbi:hypothetical protein [Methylocystis sp. WRRC1]|nr:hypothetical protein [Methylocystis sp. WRRC1]
MAALDCRFVAGGRQLKAFSSEVETGSREENASSEEIPGHSGSI